MKSYYIGVDSSTSATKALLIDEQGKIIRVASSGYSFETPHPLWSEQDPDLWWNATLKSIKKVIRGSGIDGENVKGIGLTGQMHGLVILDDKGVVLRPSILWNDQRTQKQCDAIRYKIGKEKFISITGNDALAGFTAPKILWVADEEPEIYKQIQHILLPKDYLRYKLTGVYAVDRAGGAGTVLFDLAARDWSDKVINALDIPSEWLPQTFEGTDVTGALTASAAKKSGLAEGIPVYGGGGDQAAAAVGTGAVREGIVSISLGTSGVVFATTDSPFIDPQGRLHAFCHAVPGKWHLMGVMLSAAGSLRWFRDTFRADAAYDAIVTATQGVAAGSGGLLFLPYLTGERTPHADPLARGAFIGLTVRHTFEHLTRSVLEGVAFGLRDSFELMKSAGLGTIDQVRVTGGGVKSSVWRQIIADVLNVEIVTVNSKEGAAFGAALLAAVGSGVYPSVEAACDQTIKVTEKVIPGKNNRVYDAVYQEYIQLYPALKENFHRMDSLE